MGQSISSSISDHIIEVQCFSLFVNIHSAAVVLFTPPSQQRTSNKYATVVQSIC